MDIYNLVPTAGGNLTNQSRHLIDTEIKNGNEQIIFQTTSSEIVKKRSEIEFHNKILTCNHR